MSDNFKKIQQLFYGSSGIDLKSIMHDKVDFTSVSKEDVKALKQWIKQHSDIYKMEKVILYHGTSSEHDIENVGIRKTTAKSKKSLQSQVGFVYLSLYPSMAKQFGEMAYSGKSISVYAVEVPLNQLKADLDQIRNKRLWSDGKLDHIGNSLAESLIYGSGARIKRNVEPYEVRDITQLLKDHEVTESK